MPEAITITKEQLKNALAHWEKQARAGECLGFDESRALPMDEYASAAAESLWGLLQS